MAVVRVRDNGSGIDRAVLPRIFDLFVQEQRPSRAGGIGLGLTLARRLAELHGGTIEARSGGPGMGAEFTVRLPLVDVKVAVPAAGLAGPAPESRRVLIVDDNADSGSSLRTMLRMDGHEVELATDGAAALAAARALRPDVVLLDIGLPDMDGYDVARRLRADGLAREALIVATTGYGRSQDREKSARAGIDAHLTKPVDMEQLAELLARGGRASKG
jgi:CheY-like chemotaxis protein